MAKQNPARRTPEHYLMIAGIGLLVLIASLIFASYQAITLQSAVTSQTQDLQRITALADQHRERSSLYESRAKISSSAQSFMMDFMVSDAASNRDAILDAEVNWTDLKHKLMELPAGQRKNAILGGLMLAWKDSATAAPRDAAVSGTDSPRGLRQVLNSLGIKLKATPGQRLSDALMNTFEKVGDPRPGDLVFYKAEEGSFGFLLAWVDDRGGSPVGIGMPRGAASLKIVNLASKDSPHFSFLGYYRVKYPDE